MSTKPKRPPRLDETPDFDKLLVGIDAEIGAAISNGNWFAIVGIRIFDELIANDSETADEVLLSRLRSRLGPLLRRTIRQELSDARPRDVFQPLGDVLFVLFPGTPTERIFPPLRRILEAWRHALAEATTVGKVKVNRTYHIGVVGWSPTLRSTTAKELLGFGTFMVDEAGRRSIDPGVRNQLGIPIRGREAVHLAAFHWL